MQTARLGQAVVLMMIVAVAASCAASKEYTSKLFAPRTPVATDSQAVALRFLELDNVEPDQANWVTTDIITGRDTMNRTTALDNLAQVYPSNKETDKPVAKVDELDPPALPVIEKTAPVEKTVASKRNAKVKKVKKEEQPKVVPAPSEIKTEEAESVPVARNLNMEDVRTKRTREQ